ncbi:MAG: hypothetical protein ACON4D_05125, partial [Flavobacteriales bacterium]
LYSSISLSYIIDNIYIGLGIGVDYNLSKIRNLTEETYDSNTGLTFNINSFNTITFTNFLSVSYVFK